MFLVPGTDRSFTVTARFTVFKTVFKQRPLRPPGFFDLPQGFAAVHPPTERVERADFGQYVQLGFLQLHAPDQVIDRCELALSPFALDRFGGFGTQAGDEHQAETNGVFVNRNP